MKKFIMLMLVAVCSRSIIYAQTSSPGIIFSKEQKPNNTNAKQSFTSGEFIYGSVDLGGKTVGEYFKVPEKGSNPYSYLFYIAEIYKGTELIGDNSWNFALLRDGDKKSKVLNFDVLPEPAKASTVLSGTPMFDAGLGAAPLYESISKQYFKDNGTYSIHIRIYNRSIDAYGNEQPSEKWPTVEGTFSFVFNEDDVPALLKNAGVANTAAGKALKIK